MNDKNKLTRYIIIGAQRSGTTVTHVCLKGHPNVSALNDEVNLHPLFTQGIAAFTVSGDDFLTDKEKEKKISAIFDALATANIKKDTKAIGMKIAMTSPEKAVKLVKCLQTYLKDIIVIHTIREDIIAQYGSRIRALKTGQFHSWVKKTSKDNLKIKISKFKFIIYALACQRMLEEFNILEETHKVIKVFYEKDILSNNFDIYYKLFEQLELPNININWIKSKKVAPPPDQYIKNYYELKRTLDNVLNDKYLFITVMKKILEKIIFSKRIAGFKKFIKI